MEEKHWIDSYNRTLRVQGSDPGTKALKKETPDYRSL